MNKKQREREKEMIKKDYTQPKLKKWGTVSQLTKSGQGERSWSVGSSTPFRRPKPKPHKTKWTLWFFKNR